MKILIMHTDSPYNRGDRAILAGSIRLLRDKWPDAEIWGFSENPERDKEWLGINFVNMPIQSINPIDQVRLMILARRCDIIFWGGGEIMKDYTNKAALWYWVVKMLLVRLMNKNLYGFFQGIGPTYSQVSKRLIAFTANLTKVFFVRDNESRQKLLDWGTKTTVVGSFDTAIVSTLEPPNKDLESKIKKEYGIDEEFLDNAFGVGPRAWFHYKHGGILPYKYKNKLSGKKPESPDTEKMYRNMASVIDRAVERHDINVIFFPMHLAKSEGDTESARKIISLMKHKGRTKIVDKEALSPSEFVTMVSKLKFFIGVRLHSTIIAAIAKTPVMVFYYVDKGRLFFEQINMERYSHPVEDLLDESKLELFNEKVDSLVSSRDSLSKHISKRVEYMRESLRRDFDKYVDESLK
jgi:polysaccharide pyruvyl transferase WcaK-like protein